MSWIKIKEGDPVPLDDCERLWGALPINKEFPVSYEGESDYTKARYFGLTAVAGHGSALHAGFFVGLARIGEYLLEATPRFEYLDFARMFADCSDNPVVAQRLLSRTFFVWPQEEPWIKVPVASWFSPLLVIAFLQALNELCRRHLRRNYVRAIENMTGRVKGRVRVGEQIRQNLARARLDCTVCEYGRFDDDCLENRILRAALEVSAVFLARHGAYPLVHSWIAACRVSLARVSITPIQHFHFQGARQTGSFRHYRQPIRFAWAVLRHLGISPERLSEQGEYLYVPPFALCTYELFERYAEVTLRKQYGENVWAGYSANNLGDGRDIGSDRTS